MDTTPEGHWRTTPVIAALRTTGVATAMVTEGPTDTRVFWVSCNTSFGTRIEARRYCRHGQSVTPQGERRGRSHRGRGCGSVVPTSILARSHPDRADVVEGKSRASITRSLFNSNFVSSNFNRSQTCDTPGMYQLLQQLRPCDTIISETLQSEFPGPLATRNFGGVHSAHFTHRISWYLLLRILFKQAKRNAQEAAKPPSQGDAWA